MDELRFDGRVALVTGAGHGLGRAHAMLLAARGATVVVNELGDRARDSEERAAAVVEEIRAAGGEAFVQLGDVSLQADVDAMVDRALRQFGQIDVVINNAGVNWFVPFGEMSGAE